MRLGFTFWVLFSAGALLAADPGYSRAPASGENVLYDFCSQDICEDGTVPLGGAVLDAAGDIFGTTNDGGSGKNCNQGTRGCGTVFALFRRKNQFEFRTLHSFCAKAHCSDGESPMGGLVLDASGNLYGVTQAGGKHNGGGIFELSKTGAFEVLHGFCAKPSCTDGTAVDSTATPLTYAGASSGVLYDGTSPLYGAGYGGGTRNSAGTIYSLKRNKKGKWSYKVLYDFCSVGACDDGAQPMGVIADDAGTLYGATVAGGFANKGVVFKFEDGALQVLYTFCSQSQCADGASPRGPVAIDANGNLFGTTFAGGAGDKGTIYEIGADGTFTKLYDFCSAAQCTDGAQPSAAPILDAAGDIIGTTALGGTTGNGAVYELNGSNYKVLYSFCPGYPSCSDGSGADNPLVADGKGNLYGTTVSGGTGGGGGGGGVVFEVSP